MNKNSQYRYALLRSYSQHAAGILKDTDSRHHVAHHQVPVPGADQLIRLLHEVNRAARGHKRISNQQKLKKSHEAQFTKLETHLSAAAAAEEEEEHGFSSTLRESKGDLGSVSDKNKRTAQEFAVDRYKRS